MIIKMFLIFFPIDQVGSTELKRLLDKGEVDKAFLYLKNYLRYKEQEGEIKNQLIFQGFLERFLANEKDGIAFLKSENLSGQKVFLKMKKKGEQEELEIEEEFLFDVF